LNLTGNDSFRVNWYLFFNGVLADKDEEDETAPEKVDTANDPEDKLSGGQETHSMFLWSPWTRKWIHSNIQRIPITVNSLLYRT
jgi:hypothetical protein